MSQPVMKSYPAAFTERAVQLAVESEQSLAHTARALGLHANTFHPGSGQSHRAERQEQQGHDAPRYAELQRLRPDKARLQEERESFTKAAASCAHQLPCSTRGAKRSPRRCPAVVSVGYGRSRAVAPPSGSAGPLAPPLTPRRRGRRKASRIVPRAVAPMAHAGSHPSWRRRACPSAAVAAGASWPRRGCAAQPGAPAQRRWPPARPQRAPRTTAAGS
jgi:transposase